jgi:hypothetical protein
MALKKKILLGHRTPGTRNLLITETGVLYNLSRLQGGGVCR